MDEEKAVVQITTNRAINLSWLAGRKKNWKER